jgi:hypothetical protein
MRLPSGLGANAQDGQRVADGMIKRYGTWKNRSAIKPPPGWRGEDCEAAADLWFQGFKKREIAFVCGCDKWDLATVSDRFKWPTRRDLKAAGLLPLRKRLAIPQGWTQEDYERARSMWLAGPSEMEIGAAFGKSRHVINGIAHRFGWPPRGSPIIRRENTAAPLAPKPQPFNIRPPLPAGHPLTWGLISNEPFPHHLAPVLSVGSRKRPGNFT